MVLRALAFDSFTTAYDEGTSVGLHRRQGDGLRPAAIGLFTSNSFWMARVQLCDSRVRTRDFPTPRRCGPPQPAALICVWINPYIAQRSPLFAEGAAGSYCSKRNRRFGVGRQTSGRPAWTWLDFTNPRRPPGSRGSSTVCFTMGVRRLQERLRRAHPDRRRGLARRLRPRSHAQLLRPGLQPVGLRAARRARGEATPCCSRSATAGGQRFPVHWAATAFRPTAPWRNRCARPVAGLFGVRLLEPRHRRLRGHARPAVFKRWLAFGLRRRTAGCTLRSVRVPWAFDEEAVDLTRKVHEPQALAHAVLARLGPRRTRRASR